MPSGVTIFPLSNSVAFNNTPAAGLRVLRQDSYQNNIQPWQTPLPYSQKILDTDQLTIMVHGGYIDGAENILSLHVCDHNKAPVAGTDLSASPYYKGVQITGTFTDPVTGAGWFLLGSLWRFSFSDLFSGGGIYYLRCDYTTFDRDLIQYYSEPLYVCNTHPDTLLFQCSYNTNLIAKNMVVSGWYNDYPTNTSAFYPTFGIRAEGYVIPGISGPKGFGIGYLQQDYNLLQIKTRQKRFFDLHLGDISLGVPWYMLEMATEALMADNVSITLPGDTASYGYTLYNSNTSDNLADVWKVKSSDMNPLLYASCTLVQKDDRQNAFITPSPVSVGGRVYNGVFSSVFA